MAHAETRGRLAERVALVSSGRIALPDVLRPYQHETLRRIDSWLRDADGTPRSHIVYATGLGKTVLFASIIAACPDLRILIIEPTRTLLEQTSRKIVSYTGGMIGQDSSVYSVRNAKGEVIAVRSLDASVVVAIDKSFMRHTSRIAESFKPDLIVYDECHWGYTKKAQAALQAFPEAVVIGFTATPDYLTNVIRPGYIPVELQNGMTLYGNPQRFATAHFGVKLADLGPAWGIDEGYLAPLTWGRLDLQQISLDEVPLVETDMGLDYQNLALSRKMRTAWPMICEQVTRLYQNNGYGIQERSACSSCYSIEQADELADTLRNNGVRAASYHSALPTRERHRVLDAFHRKEILHLASVTALREGWDEPLAEVCLMLRPWKSRTAYVQTLGRIMRILADDSPKISLIIDAYFSQSSLAPLSAPSVFGRPGQRVRDGGLLVETNERAQNDDDTVLVVSAPAYERELSVDADGFLTAGGVRYGSIEALNALYGARAGSIRSIGIEIRTRRYRTEHGKLRTAFAIEDMELAAAIFDRRFKSTSFINGRRWVSPYFFFLQKQLDDTLERYERIERADIADVIWMYRGKPRRLYLYADLYDLFADQLP